MDIVLVVAISENGVIGRDGGLPWKLSADLKRFKADTIGKPVVMGRKTYDSIGKPLPERLNIVVTRNPDFAADGIETVHSLSDALNLARTRSRGTVAEEICVIGGGELFTQALPIADRLKVTHVLAEIDGDTFFPAIDEDRFVETSSVEHPAGPKDSHATRYTIYERRRSAG